MLATLNEGGISVVYTYSKNLRSSKLLVRPQNYKLNKILQLYTRSHLVHALAEICYVQIYHQHNVCSRFWFIV